MPVTVGTVEICIIQKAISSHTEETSGGLKYEDSYEYPELGTHYL